MQSYFKIKINATGRLILSSDTSKTKLEFRLQTHHYQDPKTLR
jgi:hypothetical protein